VVSLGVVGLGAEAGVVVFAPSALVMVVVVVAVAERLEVGWLRGAAVVVSSSRCKAAVGGVVFACSSCRLCGRYFDPGGGHFPIGSMRCAGNSIPLAVQ